VTEAGGPSVGGLAWWVRCLKCRRKHATERVKAKSGDYCGAKDLSKRHSASVPTRQQDYLAAESVGVSRPIALRSRIAARRWFG
jgi:hypothetical protein